jgi:phage replication initiation protein
VSFHHILPGPASQAPPSGNTGALPTPADLRLNSARTHGHARAREGGASEALLDWLEWTEHDVEAGEVVDFLTGGVRFPWVQLPRCPVAGYAVAWAWGDVMVCDGGRPGMGVHVVASGKGCRQLEAHGLRLVDVLARVHEGRSVCLNVGDDPELARWSKGFSRLDVALDERGGLLSTKRMRRAISRGECVSRWTRGKGVEDFDLSGGDGGFVETLYLGNRKASKFYACVYDKAEEQRIRGNDPGEGPWMRFELRARDQRADDMARVILSEGMGGVCRVLQGYVRFVVPTDTDVNRWRWPTAGWWARFVGAVERMNLTERPEERTLDDVRGWLSTQVAASFAAVAEAQGDDFEWALSLIREGRGKLRAHHRRMIAAARPEGPSEAAQGGPDADDEVVGGVDLAAVFAQGVPEFAWRIAQESGRLAQQLDGSAEPGACAVDRRGAAQFLRGGGEGGHQAAPLR